MTQHRQVFSSLPPQDWEADVLPLVHGPQQNPVAAYSKAWWPLTLNLALTQVYGPQ